MIVFDKLWEQMKEKKVSQYRLIHSGISHSTLTRIKKNHPINTETINKLCSILHCRIEDIMEFIEDEEDSSQ